MRENTTVPDPSSTPNLEEALLELVQALAKRRCPNIPASITIKIHTDTGWEYRTKILLAPQKPSAAGDGCAGEILRTLQAVDHRLTTTALCAEMAKRGFTWADSKIKATLSLMVEEGRLTNSQSADPKGYGLPEWAG